MSVGPTNSIAGAAGASLAQTRGTDKDRAADETQQAQATDKIQGRGQADAGIDENQQASDRDGDGRTLLSGNPDQAEKPEEPDTRDDSNAQDSSATPKDPSGTLGNRLDIQG